MDEIAPVLVFWPVLYVRLGLMAVLRGLHLDLNFL